MLWLKSHCLMTTAEKSTYADRQTDRQEVDEVDEGGSYLSLGTGFTLHASSKKRTTSPCPENTRDTSYEISGQLTPLSHMQS